MKSEESTAESVRKRFTKNLQVSRPGFSSELVSAAIRGAEKIGSQKRAQAAEPYLMLGKTLKERKTTGEKVSMRADFEATFVGEAYTVTVATSKDALAGRRVLAASDIVDVSRIEHRFRVVGCVFGSGTRLGEAVDEMAEVMEAVEGHYDTDRLLEGRFFREYDHAGLVMFVTDDEMLFEMLSDQYDGVLVDAEGHVERADLHLMELRLDCRIEVE